MLLAGSGGRGHAFRCADQGLSCFKVKEIEIGDVEVFGRFENIEWDTIGFAGFFVNSVKEIEKQLEPLENNVELLLV